MESTTTDNTNMSLQFPTQMNVITLFDSETDEGEKAIKFDIALKLFMNSDFVNTKMSVEDIAKKAIRNAEIFYKIAKRADYI